MSGNKYTSLGSSARDQSQPLTPVPSGNTKLKIKMNQPTQQQTQARNSYYLINKSGNGS